MTTKKAASKSTKKATVKSKAVASKKQLPAQPKHEKLAYAKWLRTDLIPRSYEEAVTAGVKAFRQTGKRVTKAVVRDVFPEDAVAGLMFFIWDTTYNEGTATLRLLAVAAN